MHAHHVESIHVAAFKDIELFSLQEETDNFRIAKQFTRVGLNSV